MAVDVDFSPLCGKYSPLSLSAQHVMSFPPLLANDSIDLNAQLEAFIKGCHGIFSALDDPWKRGKYIQNLSEINVFELFQALNYLQYLQGICNDEQAKSFAEIENFISLGLEEAFRMSVMNSLTYNYSKNKQTAEKVEKSLRDMLSIFRKTHRVNWSSQIERIFHLSIPIRTDANNHIVMAKVFPLIGRVDTAFIVLQHMRDQKRHGDMRRLPEAQKQAFAAIFTTCLHVYVSMPKNDDQVVLSRHKRRLLEIGGIKKRFVKADDINPKKHRFTTKGTLLQSASKNLTITRNDAIHVIDLESERSVECEMINLQIDDRVALTRLAIELGADLKSRDSRGEFLLQKCANVKLFRIIAGCNVDFTVLDQFGNNLMTQAILRDQHELVYEYAKFPQFLNSENQHPLHVAVNQFNLPCIAILLNAGATLLDYRYVIDQVYGKIVNHELRLRDLLEGSPEHRFHQAEYEAWASLREYFVSRQRLIERRESGSNCSCICLNDILTCLTRCFCFCSCSCDTAVESYRSH